MATSTLPAILLTAFAVVVPVGGLAFEVLDSRDLSGTLTRPEIVSAIRFSALQAAWSTLLTVLLGGIVAWIFAQYEFRGRRALRALLTIPFVLPTVVVGGAFVALLPDRWEKGTTAIVLAHVFFNLSVVLRVVAPVWSVLDPDQLAAARCLGASPLRLVSRLVVPMAGPAIRSATALVFLMSFTSYGVVRILGGSKTRTVEVEIYRRAVLFGDVPGAAVLALVQAAFIVILFVAATRRDSMPLGRVRTRRRPAPIWALAAVSGLSLFVASPLAAMVIRSLVENGRLTTAGWRNVLAPAGSLMGNLDLTSALARSVTTALAAAAVAVPIGLAASIGLARRSGSWTRALLVLPMATSAVIIGLGILVTYDSGPFDFRSAPWLVPLVHAVIALPFVVQASLPIVRSIPRGLRDAAATLGASPVRRWLRIDAPLLAPAIATGLGLSSAMSLGEFGATSFLTRRRTETLPIVIEQLLSRSGASVFTTAMATSTVLLVLTAVVVVVFDTSLRT